MNGFKALRGAVAGVALVAASLSPAGASAKPAVPSIDALGIKLPAPPAGFKAEDRSVKGRAAAPRQLGLKFAPAEDLRKMPAVRSGRASHPAAANLLPYAPAVVNQGQQSSCVGFATTYAALTIIASVKAGALQAPFSPAYTYNRGVVLDSLGFGETPDCSKGMMVETALSLLQGFGAQPLDSFTYSDLECARIPGYATDETARRFRIAGWARAQTREDIQQSIVRGVPAVIGMQVPQTFMDYRGGIFDDETSPSMGGHAMAIVGYDDNYHVYLVMNSWGPNWGDHGYAWIKYETLEKRVLVDNLVRAFIITP